MDPRDVIVKDMTVSSLKKTVRGPFLTEEDTEDSEISSTPVSGTLLTRQDLGGGRKRKRRKI